MVKSIVRERCGVMIEGLESRQLMSGTVAAVQVHSVTPGKILAGSKTAYEVVRIHNTSADAVTEDVTLSLAPSLDGTTVAGSYGIAPVTQTVSLKKHGATTIKVPFVPPVALGPGKFYTLVTADVGGITTTTATPKPFTLTVPPASTTTPSLVGHYQGLITGKTTTTSGVGLFGHNTHVTIHSLSFIWETTSQTIGGVTGLFAVGTQQETGTQVGSENTTGAISYTFSSNLINYTILGKVTPDGQTITGTFKGTLVNNLFPTLKGHFKLALQSS